MAEDFTEASLRALFPAQEGYRHFPNRYPAGAKFSGSLSQAGQVYVFAGGCTYHTNAGRVLVQAGECADLLPGPYRFEVSSDAPVRMMKVFKLTQLGAGSGLPSVLDKKP